VKIALVGTRGVPAAYGGFETLVENIGLRLAARGHTVAVYCRPHMVGGKYKTYLGMRLVFLPTLASKHLDTIVHTFLSTLHMVTFVRPDVAFYFIAGNSPLAALSRAFGVPTIICVDGLDSRRAKWGRLASVYLRWAERNAPKCADAIVTDSKDVQRLYRDEFGAESYFIPYGSSMDGTDSGEYLERFGLTPRGYILFVGRFEAENNAHVLIEAFEGLDTSLKLVLVGDAPYSDAYRASLLMTKDERVCFTGYLYGDGYRELMRNAAVFVAPTEAGSTHPVVVEAMAAGNCVVVSDFPPNIEAVGEAGVIFPGREGSLGLRRVLSELLADPERVARSRRLSTARAQAEYSWDVVTAAYERLATEVLAARRKGRST
jgi:glycosyltransferase involved in cell wall biosynthesis